MEGFPCSCYCEGNAIVKKYFGEFGNGERGWGGGYDVLRSSNCGSCVDACVLVNEEDFVDSEVEGLAWFFFLGNKEGTGKRTLVLLGNDACR